MHETLETRADEFFGRETQDLQPCRIDSLDHAVRARDADQVARQTPQTITLARAGAHAVFERLVQLAQTLMHALRFRNVVNRAHETLAAAFGAQLAPQRDPTFAAIVGAQNANFR